MLGGGVFLEWFLIFHKNTIYLVIVFHNPILPNSPSFPLQNKSTGFLFSLSLETNRYRVNNKIKEKKMKWKRETRINSVCVEVCISVSDCISCVLSLCLFLDCFALHWPFLSVQISHHITIFFIMIFIIVCVLHSGFSYNFKY